MIQILFIMAAAAANRPPTEPVCPPYLHNSSIDRLARGLKSEDPQTIRRSLEGLLAVPVDEHAALHAFWWPRALSLAVNSREHGPLAAMAFLRFHDVKTWGDVRTEHDFAHLTEDRQKRFLTDLNAAFKEAPYRVVATIDAVERVADQEWKVTGRLRYTRELAATFFENPVRLGNRPFRKVDQLGVTFGGPNVNRARAAVTMADEDGPDLAHVEFNVSYHPGLVSREPITVTTVIKHRVAGRLRLLIPEPKQP